MKNLIILLILFLLYKLIKNLLGPQRPDADQYESKGPQEDFSPDQGREREMVRDPVCQVYLPKEEAIYRHSHGKDYYFCSQQCAERFLSNES